MDDYRGKHAVGGMADSPVYSHRNNSSDCLAAFCSLCPLFSRVHGWHGRRNYVHANRAK